VEDRSDYEIGVSSLLRAPTFARDSTRRLSAVALAKADGPQLINHASYGWQAIALPDVLCAALLSPAASCLRLEASGLESCWTQQSLSRSEIAVTFR
jgi:hypothetical protein